jgi:hypothetical protein
VFLVVGRSVDRSDFGFPFVYHLLCPLLDFIDGRFVFDEETICLSQDYCIFLPHLARR